MSAELRVKLIGPPAAYIGDEPVSGFVSIKAQALLFYLAATRETHRREALAALLWSDVPDNVARKNLRDVLFNLRQLLGPFLITTRHEVGLNPDEPTEIDSHYLLHTLTAVRHTQSIPAPISTNTLQTLAKAAGSHQGEFLAGFYAPDAPLFEDWMLAERERLRLELGYALERLAEYALSFGDYAAAEVHARRQLELDGYRETAHRQLMTALAQSGRRAEAVTHYEMLLNLLWTDLRLEPSAKTQDLIAKIRAGETIIAAPPSKPWIPTDNLPSQHAPFIGRKEELAEITGLLINESSCRLLTLVGPGGIGKTSLGVEVAGQLVEAFPHGVYFVSLAPVQDTELIVPAMGKALNFRFQGSNEPKEQLLDFLQNMQTLLLVDNFEHLLSEANLLSEILARAPGVKILATSRERLNLHEEWVYAVESLPYPSEFNHGQMEEQTLLEQYPAIHFFLQYARRASITLSVAAEEIPHVVRLCQLLNGLPLGLELAAAWVGSMTIQEIATEVARNLDFLSTTLINVPERHRSLRIVFKQTWQALSADEQSVLANLSVFRGGCRQEAAEKVAGATLFILSSLRDKALLHRSLDGRYDMHEMIRQYASEQLKIHITDYESTRNRHSAYFADFLQQLEEDTVGWNMLKTFKKIGEENDNVFAALTWAITQKDASIFEQAAETLWQYWPYASLERQGVKIMDRAVTALTGSAERGIAVHYPRLSPKVRTIVGFLIATAGHYIGRNESLQQGKALSAQGVALQDTSTPSEKRRLAWSKFWLGQNYYLTGNYQEAEPEFREALTLFSTVEYPCGMAWSLNRLGSIRYLHGRFKEAERYFEESNKLSDDLGFFLVGSHTRLLQAMKANDQGNYTRAMELLNKSTALLSRGVGGDFLTLAGPARERARVYSLLGQYDSAKEELDQSMVLYRKHGSVWHIEINLNIAGDLNRLQGDFDKAEQFYKRSLSAAREVNNQRLTATILSGLGTVAYERGKYAMAEKIQLEALDIFQGFGNEPETASVLRHLGQVTMASGKDGYKHYYKEALRLAEIYRLAPVALDVMVGIAQLYYQSGKNLEAVELLTMVTEHESSTYETKTNALHVLDMMAADIDKDLIEITQSRGREQDLWQITGNILDNGL